MNVFWTELPEAVYRCDRIWLGDTSRNEVLVSRHATVREAMDEANRLARLDRSHSYTVGAAE